MPKDPINAKTIPKPREKFPFPKKAKAIPEANAVIGAIKNILNLLCNIISIFY